MVLVEPWTSGVAVEFVMEFAVEFVVEFVLEFAVVKKCTGFVGWECMWLDAM